MRLLLIFIIILSSCNSAQQKKERLEDSLKTIGKELVINQEKIDSVSDAILQKKENIFKSNPGINKDSLAAALIAERDELIKPYLFKRVGLKAFYDSLDAELKKY